MENRWFGSCPIQYNTRISMRGMPRYEYLTKVGMFNSIYGLYCSQQKLIKIDQISIIMYKVGK